MNMRWLCIAGAVVLAACGRTENGGESRAAASAMARPAASQAAATGSMVQPAQQDAVRIKGFYLGMDIQGVPDAMVELLADRQLSGFGFTGVIRLSNGAQCVLMYDKSFMAALEARARDRFGEARAPGKVDEEIATSCENSDGVMTVHAGADGRVTRIQFNDTRNLLDAEGVSPAEFAHRMAAEMHIPELQPDESRSAWNYTGPQGTNIAVETKTALGVSLLRLIVSKAEP